MIAKLEWTQSNAQQNKDKHRNPTTNGKRTKQRITNNRTIFALDSAVVEVQEMFSSQVSSLCKNVSSLCKNVSSLYTIMSSVC